MNWKKFFDVLQKLTPYVIGGVELIHGDKDSKTKQQLATEALVVASTAAAQVDPDDTETIAAATVVTKAIIDSTVAKNNADGTFKKKKSVDPASPVPAVSAPVPPAAPVEPEPAGGLHTVVAD